MHVRLSVAALLFSAMPLAHAATIASYTAGTTGNSSAYYGFSFTVAATGVYDDITLNFITPGGTPYAVGTGFLFSSAYTGTPGGLGSASAGLLGSAVASGGEYTFASTLDLTGGTKYYFYENALTPGGAQTGSGSSTYIGGNLYVSDTSTSTFISENTQMPNFQVAGLAVSATPEPPSFVLLGTGLLGLAGVAKRRFV